MVPMNFLPEGRPRTTSSPAPGARRRSRRRSSLGTARVAAHHRRTRTSATRASRSQAELKLDPNAAYVHITTQQHHLRHAVARLPGRGQGAARRRHVDRLPVAADRRLAVRAHLRRRAEEHRALGRDGGRSSARTSWRRAARTSRRSSATPTHAENNSLYNTPPTFAHLPDAQRARLDRRSMGGLAAIETRNREKARAPLRRDRPDERLLPRAGREGEPLA